jgi:hypothetical protein
VPGSKFLCRAKFLLLASLPLIELAFYLRLDVLHGFVGIINVREQVITQLGWTEGVLGDLRGESTCQVVQFPVNSGVGLVFVI